MSASTLLLILSLLLGLALLLLVMRRYLKHSIAHAVDSSKPYSYYRGRFCQDKVFYCRGGSVSHRSLEVAGADLASFKVVDYYFAKDKYRVYYKNMPIDVVDVASFYIDEQQMPKDAQHVYVIDGVDGGAVCARIIEDANPRNFHKIDSYPGWAKDDKHYFFKSAKQSVDYESFEFLSPFWAKDHQQFYRLSDKGLEVIQAEVHSVFMLSDNVLRDEKHVYYAGMLPGARSSRKYVFHCFDYHDGADVELLSDYHIRHAGVVYFCGQQTDKDAATFHVFNLNGQMFHGFSKDKYCVYKYNKKLTHIDVASFRLEGDVMRDKYNRYSIDGDLFASPFQG